MNDSKHAGNSIAILTGDKIRMEQFCYLSLQSQYSRHMPACPRGLVLSQFQNNVKRLGIAIPELFLIRIRKRILDI
jgi:hypothetical protein